jgi:hypothetical protein
VASSANGTKLVAVSTDLDPATLKLVGGNIYTSSDSGATWTQTGTKQHWNSVASSSDGTKLVAAGGGPDTDAGGAYTGGACIYTSADSGATWTQTTAPRLSWAPVASSADGTKLVAVAVGHGIYTSADSGATWTQTTAPDPFWQSVASSANGTKLVAVSTDLDPATLKLVGGNIYTSSDSGATWTQTGTKQHWNSVASSSDGTKLVAVSGDLLAPLKIIGGYIYTSSDSGTTWTQRL